MGITPNDIYKLVARFSNSIVTEQANEMSPLIDKGILKQKKITDKVGIVNITAGEMASVGMVSSGGSLPQGTNVLPVQATYLPVNIFGRIAIPRDSANLASSTEDGVDIVSQQMRICGQALGRQRGRALVASSLGAIAANIAAGQTSFTVNDPSPYRVGMAFEVFNGSTAIEGTTEADLLVVSNIAYTLDGSPATITFVGKGSGGSNINAWTTGYTLYLRGAKSSGTFTSLADVCAASSLYGVANTSNEWSGNLDSTTPVLSLPAMQNLYSMIRRRRGAKPTHVLVNTTREASYTNLLINNKRFAPGQQMDAVGGMDLEYHGLPVIVDDNVNDTDLFMFNQEDMMLHVFRDFAPDFDGEAAKGMNRGAVIVSDSLFVYDVQVWGSFNLRVERRNGTGQMNNLSA